MAKTAAKREHRAIPYNRIAKMWKEGKTYEQMAKAIKRFNDKSPDPTKPTRAIVSRMLTVGFADDSGKLVKLAPRDGMRAIGVGKTVAKASKKAKVKVAKKTPKVVAKKGPKTAKVKAAKTPIAIVLHDSGKLIQLRIGKREALASVEDALPQLIGVADKLGYSVVPKDTQVVTTAATVAASTEAPAPAPNTDGDQQNNQQGNDSNAGDNTGDVLEAA